MTDLTSLTGLIQVPQKAFETTKLNVFGDEHCYAELAL